MTSRSDIKEVFFVEISRHEECLKDIMCVIVFSSAVLQSSPTRKVSERLIFGGEVLV